MYIYSPGIWVNANELNIGDVVIIVKSNKTFNCSGNIGKLSELPKKDIIAQIVARNFNTPEGIIPAVRWSYNMVGTNPALHYQFPEAINIHASERVIMIGGNITPLELFTYYYEETQAVSEAINKAVAVLKPYVSE